jgi:hypothetical protein
MYLGCSRGENQGHTGEIIFPHTTIPVPSAADNTQAQVASLLHFCKFFFNRRLESGADTSPGGVHM